MENLIPHEKGKWVSRETFDIQYSKFRKEFCDSVPELPAVYVVYFSSGGLYIGSTTNLKKRIYGHCIFKRAAFQLDYVVQIKYKICIKYGCWLMLEARLIRKLMPKLNRRFHFVRKDY